MKAIGRFFRLKYGKTGVFRGMVVGLEVVEKAEDMGYVHAHAIVVRNPGLSFDYEVMNAAWRQLTGSYLKVKPTVNVGKKIGYALGYASKGGKDLSPQGLVNFVKRMRGRRLVRAFGCLFGGGKGRC